MVHAESVGTSPDRVEVVFDDERAVADAEIVLVAALATRLKVQQIVEECVDLGERPGSTPSSRRSRAQGG